MRSERLARLLVARIRKQFLIWSGSWWFLLTLVFQEIVGVLIGLFVWVAVFPGDPRVVAYYVALAGVKLATTSFENHTFSGQIYEGTLSHELLRPQPVVIGPLGENLAIRSWLLLAGLPMVMVTGFVLKAWYDWRLLLLAALVVPLSAALSFLWCWTLALMAFWTERVHAVVGFGWTLVFLLGGSAAPVALLPSPWDSLARMLPFYAMAGLPADIATGAAGLDAVVPALGWLVVLAASATVVWRIGIRRYTVVGA